jgi:transcriptional regulator with XRE-family HTH domain
MKNLKEARQAKNLRQYEMKALTGISVPSYSLLENGKRVPRSESQVAIERALDQRINWLETSGFDSVAYGESDDWAHAEQNLRKAMKDIKKLENKLERAKYIQMIRYYADVLEREFIKPKSIQL